MESNPTNPKGKSLIKYRHERLKIMDQANGEMKHAAMRLGWGKQWKQKAKTDLLHAGMVYGKAMEEHWQTL